MGYEIRNNIEKGYLQLIKNNKLIESFENILDKHNVDLDDYWVIKMTDRFRFIEKDRYEKYAGIICFSKKIYKKEDIQKWIDFLYNRLDLMIKYLTKPFPPVEILNKIKLVDFQIDKK